MNIEVLVGKQTAKGTEATSFKRFYATDSSISPDVSTTESQALTGSRFFQGMSFASRINVTGSIPVEFTPDTLIWALKEGGFGVQDSTAETLKASDSVDSWLTVITNFKGEGCYEKIIDCKINTISLNIATESFVTGEIGIVGSNAEFISTGYFEGLIDNPTDSQLICLNSTATAFGTDISAQLSNANIEINNNLEGVTGLNTIYNADIREGTASLTSDITYNKFDKTIYKNGMDALLSSSQTSLEYLLGTEDEDKYVKITIPKATLSGNSKGDLSGFGSISQSFSAVYDSDLETNMIVEGKGYLGA